MSSFTVPAAARRLAGLLVFALVLSLLASCGRGRAPDEHAPPGGEPPGIGTEPGDGSGAEPGESPPTSSVPAWLEYLTLEEKLGQLFWVGLPGTELTEEIRQLLAGGKVGGVIFFGRQGSDPDVLRGLTEALQAAAATRDRATPGLVIAVDHEGGLVQRFGPPFTQWPGAMTLGAAGSAAYAEAMGRAMARELRAVGVNMNLAPVADVNNNPENPVIGTRSFGEAPERVARAGGRRDGGAAGWKGSARSPSTSPATATRRWTATWTCPSSPTDGSGWTGWSWCPSGRPSTRTSTPSWLRTSSSPPWRRTAGPAASRPTW